MTNGMLFAFDFQQQKLVIIPHLTPYWFNIDNMSAKNFRSNKPNEETHQTNEKKN
jgi:hypothetical protein